MKKSMCLVSRFLGCLVAMMLMLPVGVAAAGENCAKPDYWYKCNKNVANSEDGTRHTRKGIQCTPRITYCYCTKKCEVCGYVYSKRTNMHRCYINHYCGLGTDRSPCTLS